MVTAAPSATQPLDRKFDAELRDWTFTTNRLHGRIYFDSMTDGHHPFKDGEFISTSPVERITSSENHMVKIAVTRSGTRYLLR